MSTFDSMDRAVTMECNCCGNREASRFVKREDGYVCKCCGQWFRYQTDAEKSRCSQGYESLSNYKFDDARNIFQRVIIDNPGSVSARWGLLLSRFGIVFAKAFTGQEAEPLYCFPEYEDIRSKRFSGEEEYAEMMELIGDDGELAHFYGTKAGEIDSAIEKICESRILKKNDVFISVKSDAATERHPELEGETEDFRFAKKIYADLTAHGVDVFFTAGEGARSDTLVWSNLVKSKKMLLIVSKEEYAESVWVKSEWRRWNSLGRQSELYILVLKHENESPKSVLPHELLKNENQIYTLDTYEKLINEVSADDSYVLEGQENGRIKLGNGREERIRYGIAEISANAYKGRKDIVSVSLPATVAVVGKSAFAGCMNMESLTLRSGARIIEDNAFSGCDGLREVSLPATVTEIGNGAFRGCNGLIALDVPPKTRKIGEGAFSGCGGIMSISIPKSTEQIGMGALSGCKNLKAITVDAENKHYESLGNCLVEKVSGTLIAGCMGSVIPTGGKIKSIGKSAFAGCDIRNAAVPEGVTVIGEGAFASCAELASISIAGSVCEIGEGAFALCGNLRKISAEGESSFFKSEGNCLINKQNKILTVGCGESVIPNDGSVKTIGAKAFMGASFAEFTIPEGVEFIENDAFRACAELCEITVPASIISIGEDAFRDCQKLKKVNFAASPETWLKISVAGGNEALTAAYSGIAPKKEERFSRTPAFGGYGQEQAALRTPREDGFAFSDSAGHGCRADTGRGFSYTSPYGAEDKASGKIVYSDGGEERILRGVKEIRDGEYSGRNDVVRAELPEGVKSIGRNAFGSCAKLEEIVIPASVTAIGERAFSSCKALREIKLPVDVKKIGASAFRGCDSLKEVKIPESVTAIESDCFANCGKLESVTIHSDVRKIGERAFCECASLKNIYYGGTQRQWKEIEIGAGNPKMGGLFAKIKVNFNA